MNHTKSKWSLVVRWKAEVSRSVTSENQKNYPISHKINIFGNLLGLGLGLITGQKKKACPARGPKQDREIFRGCMSRSPYKSQASSEDRVAVLWKSPATRNPST